MVGVVQVKREGGFGKLLVHRKARTARAQWPTMGPRGSHGPGFPCSLPDLRLSERFCGWGPRSHLRPPSAGAEILSYLGCAVSVSRVGGIAHLLRLLPLLCP